MTLASNEALYAWMDEGFTDFASSEAMSSILSETSPPHQGSYSSYFSLVNSGLQEPANQHSDHFNTNRAYSTMAYSMGAVFLEQLKYIIGEDNFYRGMKRYYNTWKMKHPEPNDFIRIMEKTSGLQLHWYWRYWINTTKRIDYGIGRIAETGGNTLVELNRIGEFPMPIDLTVTFKDGSKQLYYISMNELLGNKPPENIIEGRITLEPWPWVNSSYSLIINKKESSIESIEIDPSQRMADVNRKNNKIVLSELKPYVNPTK
ncbi:MAG: M1 family aminopeptidase, partial [Cyclobacteriaceae bacterium]